MLLRPLRRATRIVTTSKFLASPISLRPTCTLPTASLAQRAPSFHSLHTSTFRMSTYSSPLTQAVTAAMRKLYPEALADKSFDNTGLLLDAPHDPTSPAHQARTKVLLTIDLTTAVADEAIAKNAGIVIAYHPIIFRALKSLTQSNTQKRTLLRLASHGISVYCPHTAVDAAVGGNGDWLLDLMILQRMPAGVARDPTPLEKLAHNSAEYCRYAFPAITAHEAGSQAELPHARAPVVPTGVAGHEGAGAGRLATLDHAVALRLLLGALTRALGSPKAFQIALPAGTDIKDITIQRVAVCAGSGASVLSNVPAREDEGSGHRDLWITGELAHHEALAARENGIVVVCLGHSNSERGYLTHVLRGKLKAALGKGVEVLLSEKDEDPLTPVVLERVARR